MRLTVVVFATLVSVVQSLPNKRCMDPQFQEDELVKFLKARADVLAKDTIGATTEQKLSWKADRDRTYADINEARAKISAVVDPTNRQIESRVLINQAARLETEHIKSACNLPQTNGLEKAITQLSVEVLEGSYGKASGEERKDIIWRIINEAGIFPDGSPKSKPTSFMNSTCHLPEFQEKEVTKYMKDFADSMALKSCLESDTQKLISKATLDLTYANDTDARMKIIAAFKTNSFLNNIAESKINTFVSINRMTRDEYQEYKKQCNLPETNEFEKALTQLMFESLEVRYFEGTQEQRMAIVKRIVRENNVFPKPQITKESRKMPMIIFNASFSILLLEYVTSF